ncbi:MAG TPA: carbon-nitrogen hydrolase family protein [Planctomycetota bacterium]|nr:carbon-nitrogen hydrolase family protein [Planctomycetota bacterium]
MVALAFVLASLAAQESPGPRQGAVRVAAVSPAARFVDPRLEAREEILAAVDRNLAALESLVDRAAAEGAAAVALPEDTPGLGRWEDARPERLPEILPEAVRRMLERLGRAAARHRLYLVCCSDTFEEGAVSNTAFLLGRDGREIGRYRKVNLPLQEQDKRRGTEFPVFPTPDLGAVGMLICYDMVFPEAPRCLALAGADIIFHPTLGGAAIGDADISRAAFRTRAVENFVYLVVAHRGGGSLVISPQGRILAEAPGPDTLAVADIDPFGGREGGDAFNRQRDMRARLFRERSPQAFGILTDPDPPVLAKAPLPVPVERVIRIARAAHATGDERYRRAAELQREGKREEAIRAFEALREEFPGTWIERAARDRLKELRP